MARSFDPVDRPTLRLEPILYESTDCQWACQSLPICYMDAPSHSDRGTRTERPKQRRGETVDFVVGEIRDGILSGRYAPGQRLIARDITDYVGFSRGPVREALRRLAAEGLVQIVPNRGAMVRHLTKKQVQDLFVVRKNLEGLAARLAAEHINDGSNRRNFEDVWEQVRPKGSELPWSEFIRQNRLYHHTIVSIGGNDPLSGLIATLQLPVVMLQIGRAMQPQHTRVSHEDHVLVAEAILAADADAAELAMRQHLQRSHDWIVTLPDSAFRWAS
jgi:DNA-binding GntR family transcriptional regulator